jgi:hypothetical protein
MIVDEAKTNRMRLTASGPVITVQTKRGGMKAYQLTTALSSVATAPAVRPPINVAARTAGK